MQTVTGATSNFRQLAEDMRILFGPLAQQAATDAAKEFLEAGDERRCMTWLQVIHALDGSGELPPLSAPEITERAFALII